MKLTALQGSNSVGLFDFETGIGCWALGWAGNPSYNSFVAFSKTPAAFESAYQKHKRKFKNGKYWT